MAHTVIDTIELTVFGLFFVTKVVRLVLAVHSTVRRVFAVSAGAITVVLVFGAFGDSNALSSVEAMVLPTFVACNFTLKTMKAFWALTVLVIRMLLPEVIRKLFASRRDLLDAKPAGTFIMTFQGTFWHSVFLKLAVRPVVEWSAVTWAAWVVPVVSLAIATVDTEELALGITGLSFWNLAVLANVLDTVLINSPRAVAEELIVAVNITQSQETRSTVVALVVDIGAVFIL